MTLSYMHWGPGNSDQIGVQTWGSFSLQWSNVTPGNQELYTIFQAPETGNIDRITLRVAPDIAGVWTMNIGIVDIDANGDPTHTPVAGSSIETIDIQFVSPDNRSSHRSFNTYYLTSMAYLTRGNTYAVIIWYSSHSGGGASPRLKLPLMGIYDDLTNNTPILPYTGYKRNTDSIRYGLNFNGFSGLGATYDNDHPAILAAVDSQIRYVSYSPDDPLNKYTEAGLKFIAPFTSVLVGVKHQGWGAYPLVITVYDDLDTVLTTKSFANYSSYGGYGQFLFDEDVGITAGSTYRITVSTTATGEYIITGQWNTYSGYAQGFGLANSGEFIQTEGIAGSSWNDTPYLAQFMSLLLQPANSIIPPVDGPPDDCPEPDFGGSVITLLFVYEWRDHLFNFIADITPTVISCDISLDNERQVSRIARFEIDPDDLPVLFDITRDRISVHAMLVQSGLTYLFPMGLFALDLSRRSFSPSGNPLDFTLVPIPPKTKQLWSVDGSGMEMHLQESSISKPYTVHAGTNYITAVETIINAVQFYDLTGVLKPLRSIFPASSLVTPFDYTWGPKTSRLDIINELLMALNWYPLWADEKGTLRSREQVAPSEEVPNNEYSTDLEPRMIIPPFELSRLRGQFPNQVAVPIDDPRRPPSYAFRENYGLGSAISVSNMEPRVEEIDGSKMYNLSRARDLADYKLGLADAQSTEASLKTDFDPRRSSHETYKLTISGVEDGTLWKVFGWSLEMATGAIMTHKIGRANILSLRTVVQ